MLTSDCNPKQFPFLGKEEPSKPMKLCINTQPVPHWHVGFWRSRQGSKVHVIKVLQVMTSTDMLGLPASAYPLHQAGASTDVLLSIAALIDELETNKP